MKKERPVLKRKTRKTGKRSLFADKKKRYLFMLLLMLPFIIAIGIFSSIVVKELKSIASLADNTAVVETKPENIIEPAGYLLRDNATDLQKQYFEELKEAIEGEEPADLATVAGLVGKNYVADFYTWTNKSGQYDIGGFSYIYNGEFENGDDYKENVYLRARDGFYKYLSTYATQYGKDKLLEVENVEVVSCEKMSSPYAISQHISYKQDEAGEWYDYREDVLYDAYNVKLHWSYKEGSSLNLNQFTDSINLAVINAEGNLYIIEASDTPINGRTSGVEDITQDSMTESEAE